FMAKGAIPSEHPLAAAPVGMGSDDPGRAGFGDPDVWSAIGHDPVEWGPVRFNPTGRLRIVHIDFTAAEVDARYQPVVEVAADVGEALELLAPLVAVRPERVPPPRPPEDGRRRDESFPLLPQRVIAD